MIRLSHREGSTAPVLFDLGVIPRNSRAVQGSGIDFREADSIVLFCRSERDPQIIKVFSLEDEHIEVSQADDDLYRRLSVTFPSGATGLLYRDRSYLCYFEITQDEEVSTWPEGDVETPYFVIEMLEKLSVS